MNTSEISKEELVVKDDNQSSTNIIELQKSGFKLKLVEKLSEIDRRYKEGVLEYKESIQAYNIEIEKLKNKIALEKESCDREEQKLLHIEYELVFENKAYDSLDVKFSTCLSSIEELKLEYKDVLDALRYESTLKRKEKELFDLLDEIELSELMILKKELLRLNILEIFEPKEKCLKGLEISLKELEMEKGYFESMGLHKVANVQLENKSFWNKDTSEIVDTIELKDA